MAHTVVSINSRDLWSEVRKVKGRNKISSNVDGSCDSKEITELFSEKYKHLYNSVPYNIDDMHAIESTIFERLHNCENLKYVISHSDVINAVSHLKNGKSDGSEGLFSDHFLHATHRFYVILSILYTLFLSHGFSPDSMIMGTMIPIPKNRKQSLCNSSNYRAIALSSIFGKILDWVILIKEESALCSSHLQFGFKKRDVHNAVHL